MRKLFAFLFLVGCAGAGPQPSERFATTAQALGSYAEEHNYGNVASGDYSFAEGFGSTASGIYSHAEGLEGVSGGHAAHSEGQSTSASGDNSHAEGEDTIAAGLRSHAEGEAGFANALASFAHGGDTIADAPYSEASGKLARAYLNTQRAFASGAFEGGSAFDKTDVGSAQWSDLVLRGLSAGVSSAETIYIKYDASDIYVTVDDHDAAYVIEIAMVATQVSGTRFDEVLTETCLASVASGATTITCGSPTVLGTTLGTLTVSASGHGWTNTFLTNATRVMRLVIHEQWTNVRFPI